MNGELAVDAIAGYRLTKLVTDDVITAPIRDRIVARAYIAHEGRVAALRWRRANPYDSWSDRAMDDRAAPKLATLVTCRWCAGVWIATGIVAARRLAPRWWQPVAEGCVVAAAAALVARLED